MTPSTRAVVLPAGSSGSSLFHEVLATVAARYAHVFERARLPATPHAFKRDDGGALARFEAARVSSPERSEIARALVQTAQEAFRFGDAQQGVPLAEYLSTRVPWPNLEYRVHGVRRGLSVELPFEGRVHRGKAAQTVIERLRAAHQLSDAAYTAASWIIERLGDDALDLHGERFVLLGAGAELAPSEMLLRAGATVLWLDLADPARLASTEGGTLVRAGVEASNILERPREIAAAIRAFAVDGPVHIGMFAYAPGASREWRLGAAMHAIVASLEPELVRSVSMLISPTTPAVLSAEAVQAAQLRKLNSPAWQRVLGRARVISEPGHHAERDVRVSRSTVSLQGSSYQAAQYLCKTAAAESYAIHGTNPSVERAQPITVSANVAGITRTRSLSHPLFSAAFLGAEEFGVRIFEPATTRALGGLLMLHDLLNPEAPGAAEAHSTDCRAKASGLLAQQVHGGVYGLPWVLEDVIRVAALVGIANRPSLLFSKEVRSPALVVAAQ
jgi:hypothetical protein